MSGRSRTPSTVRLTAGPSGHASLRRVPDTVVLHRTAWSGRLTQKEVRQDMQLFSQLVASFRNDEDGQGLAEYALILALIAIIAIVALIFLGGQVSTILSKVGASI